MTQSKCPPRPWGSEAGEYLEHRDHTATSRRNQPARCAWHAIAFREAFPPKCPLSTPNPVDALTRMKRAAWAELGGHDSDPSAERGEALDLLTQTEVCLGCLGTGLTHPVVLRLRRRAGLSA